MNGVNEIVNIYKFILVFGALVLFCGSAFSQEGGEANLEEQMIPLRKSLPNFELVKPLPQSRLGQLDLESVEEAEVGAVARSGRMYFLRIKEPKNNVIPMPNGKINESIYYHLRIKEF